MSVPDGREHPKVFLLLISKKGAHIVHSCHKTMEQCQSWKECKEHDGDDCLIAIIDKDTIDDMITIMEKR